MLVVSPVTQNKPDPLLAMFTTMQTLPDMMSSAGSLVKIVAPSPLHIMFQLPMTIVTAMSQRSQVHTYVGGIVGLNVGATLTNVRSASAVSGSGNRIGGLIGSNTGSLTASVLGTTFAANHSYAVGTVTGTGAAGSSSIGGLIGYNEGNITNAYNTQSLPALIIQMSAVLLAVATAQQR